MKEVKIPKRGGGYRTIVVPGWRAKEKFRAAGQKIAEYVASQPGSAVIHGFAKARSPITNAMAHIGYQYTVSFDLENFFDSIHEHILWSDLPQGIKIADVTYNGRAAQGLPSSPAVANLAGLTIDRKIAKFLDTIDYYNIIYTRYADDLTFSFNDSKVRPMLLEVIPAIVEWCGYKINHKKTTYQSARAGNRIITGIAVTATGVQPTRETRRKLRAAEHQSKIPQIIGLREWMRCKLPKEFKCPPEPLQ
jgi:hypothetical protein